MNNTVHRPNYYFRDYNNDFPKEKSTSQVIRITKVALPFISLYQPAGKILTGSLSVMRSITSVQRSLNADSFEKASWEVLNTSLALASVAGTVFLHPLGMVITTLNDMGVTLYELYGAAHQGDYTEIARQVMHLANHTLYLSIMMSGSLELQIASLAIQVITEGVSSIEEYKKGNWLEATSHALMGGIRASQLHNRVEKLQIKWKADEAVRSIYVGRLHEKWQFPSDHLPIGVEVDGKKVVSWNVLNNAYTSWFTKNDTQGLNGSMITGLNRLIPGGNITYRDQRVIEMVQSMIASDTGLIALQECGLPFIENLEKAIPSDWHIVRSTDKAKLDQDIILYSSKDFTYEASKSHMSFDGYPCQIGKGIQNAFFTSSDGRSMRLFNSHIPGNPALPGKEEFAQYVYNHSDGEDLTLALGDYNFERDEMNGAFQKAGFWDFSLFSPWQSNIDPYTKKSKGIDHVFVSGDVSARCLTPDEMLDSKYQLQETIDLLRTEQKN